MFREKASAKNHFYKNFLSSGLLQEIRAVGPEPLLIVLQKMKIWRSASTAASGFVGRSCMN
ncbi:MAG: hypothetical protein M3139_03600 [Bacteroidota bacterium]|nr:hypothetical protein [Bacteroidota bacterium]